MVGTRGYCVKFCKTRIPQGGHTWAPAGRAVVLSLLCLVLWSASGTTAALARCDSQCQASQALALSRVQAALLGPGQDPGLLMLPPGEAAVLAGRASTGGNEAGGGGPGPPASTGQGPPLQGGSPPMWPSDLPAHCRVQGARLRSYHDS